MKFPSALDALTEALRFLPGVGPVCAAHGVSLLQRDQAGAARLSDALRTAVTRIRHCAHCNTFTEQEACEITRLRATAHCCAWLKRRRSIDDGADPHLSWACISCSWADCRRSMAWGRATFTWTYWRNGCLPVK